MEVMERAIFFMMADLYLLGDELPAQKLGASNLSNRGEAKLAIDLAERVSETLLVESWNCMVSLVNA
jgi:hypothetical protein